MSSYDDDLWQVPDDPKPPLTPGVVKRSVALIGASLVGSALMIWIVKFEVVLWFMAYFLELSILILGAFAASKVYDFIPKAFPHGVRLTVAIILGFVVSITALELSRSHKLIRISEQAFSNRSDD
jgi:hypothetical protein